MKKKGGYLYKLTELNADHELEEATSIDGFSVSLKTPDFFHEKVMRHFRSDFFAIILVIEGEIVLSVNLTKYVAGKNDLLLSSPNSIKQLISLRKGSKVAFLSFTSDFLTRINMPRKMNDLMGYYSSQFAPIWHLKAKDTTHVVAMMRQLEQRARQLEVHPFGKELLHYTFYTFLYEMAGMSLRYASQVSIQLSRKENLVVQFTNLVQRQCKVNRSVQAYAAQLTITPKYLTETVKEMTGKTAGELIDDHVLLEAKLLLEDPSYSIAQVADELSFSDQSFFGKFFKRFTGLSPKEYRQTV